MIVKELIELLETVQDKNSIVMFDPVNGFKNEGIIGYDAVRFSVDDVLVGYGTQKGFVYLTEDELTD